MIEISYDPPVRLDQFVSKKDYYMFLIDVTEKEYAMLIITPPEERTAFDNHSIDELEKKLGQRYKSLMNLTKPNEYEYIIKSKTLR